MSALTTVNAVKLYHILSGMNCRSKHTTLPHVKSKRFAFTAIIEEFFLSVLWEIDYVKTAEIFRGVIINFKHGNGTLWNCPLCD